MHVRSLIYGALIFAGACSEGDGIPSTSPSQSIAWALNEALNKSFIEETMGSSFASPSNGLQFSSIVSFKICSDDKPTIKFNETSIDFDEIVCRSVKFARLDPSDPLFGTEEDYYVMAATRKYGSFLEIFNFTFLGTNPGNKEHNVQMIGSYASYNIYFVRDDGKYESIETYYPVSGNIITTSRGEGVKASISRMTFREFQYDELIVISTTLSCCSK